MNACDAVPAARARSSRGSPADIERARRKHRPSAELLALRDAALLAALAGGAARCWIGAYAAFDAAAAREQIAAAGLAAICRHDAAYPPPLAQPPDAPAVLHVAGDPARLAELGQRGHCRRSPSSGRAAPGPMAWRSPAAWGAGSPRRA